MDEIDTSQQNTSNDDAESNDEHVSKTKEKYTQRTVAPCPSPFICVLPKK